jgi:hypothetical protein
MEAGKIETGGAVRSPLRALDSSRAAYAPALPPIVFDLEAGNDYLQVRVDGAALRVAFCGSNDKQDWKSNKDFNLVDTLLLGRVHSGFYAAWDTLRGRLRYKLRCYAGMPIFIEGHSRGGSIGTIAAAEIGNHWQEFGQIETLTTFAAAMPGNIALANNTVRGCREIRRYVTEALPLPGFRDEVPHLPPGPGYCHPCKPIKLRAYGRPSKLHSLAVYRKALQKK